MFDQDRPRPKRWLNVFALALASVAASAAPVWAQDATRFDINAFQVKGNTLIPTGEVEALVYPFMGPGRTPDDVEAARAALQAAYETRGYATVSVVIPEQGVDTGVIRLEVQPQTVGQVRVEGAVRTSEARILAQAPSLTAGATPNFNDVQRDILALNQSPDRRVTPEVTAGVAPGTVDVVLTVEESSPLHATVEINNYSSAATTDLRVASTFRYDDLWGRGDSVSVSAQTAPERPEDGTVFSGNYLTRLPIWNAQLLGYYVHSDSDIAVVGGTSVVGRGDLAGVRLITPLPARENFYQSLTIGFDFKDFGEDLTLGEARDSAPIQYWPFTIGWRGDWVGETVQSNASLSTTFGVRGLGDGLEAFDSKRYLARPNFIYLRGEAAQTAEVIGGFQLHVKATGQWSAEPLISNEQFSLGGMETVRGYFESEALGDYGVATQIELRTPELAQLWTGEDGLIDELRLITFADAGFTGIHDPLPGQDDSFLLMSAGLGVRMRLYDYVNGAVFVATPVASGPNKDRGDITLRFRLWGEF